jgi:hypothetical protein
MYKMEFAFHIRKSLFFPYLLAFKEYMRGRRSRDLSQFGEHEIISKLIPNSPGSYLDIGSGRPVSGSNTYALYKMGWSGILVDPIKVNIVSSKLIRSRDRCFNAIVGNVGKTTFYEFFPYQFSTTSLDVAKNVLMENEWVQFVRQYSVLGESAAYFYEKVPPRQFVFVNIDAEGFDFEVLLSLNLNVNRPNLICIEDWGFEKSGRSRISDLLLSHGYTLVDQSGPSFFYMK